LLSACGGSAGGSDGSDPIAGIGGTGIVFGKITSFGSVFVNGGEYDIDTSLFDVDGDTGADQGDLALGMVIQLKVETENGVYTGKVLEVVYDDEIEGPVSGVDPPLGTTKIIHVFGQDITIDETSTLFEGTSFATITVDDVVEVSGFRVSATEINATYVEKTGVLMPGVSEVELRGDIEQYMGGSTFEIDGTVINFDPTGVATEIDVPGGVISNGLYVEIEGIIRADQSVDADKIEEEDEDFDDDVDAISLQGVVSGFTDIALDFFIDSQLVNASTAQLSPDSLTLVDGLNIEVEGEIVGGKLIADEVELREGKSELRSTISMVDTINRWFEVTYPPGSVIVRTNSQTVFEDETGVVPSETFSINDLNMMDFVRVEGQEVNDEVVATVVKRTDPDSSLKLEGAVDTFVTNSSITILGITYGVDPTQGTGTDFEGFASSADFFAALDPAGGDFVEIEDDDVADGIADEVELE
jgi:hypothetical protein